MNLFVFIEQTIWANFSRSSDILIHLLANRNIFYRYRDLILDEERLLRILHRKAGIDPSSDKRIDTVETQVCDTTTAPRVLTPTEKESFDNFRTEYAGVLADFEFTRFSKFLLQLENHYITHSGKPIEEANLIKIRTVFEKNPPQESLITGDHPTQLKSLNIKNESLQLKMNSISTKIVLENLSNLKLDFFLTLDLK